MTTVEVALVSRNSDQRLSPTVAVTALPVLPISRVLSVEKGVHHTSVTASRHTPVLPRVPPVLLPPQSRTRSTRYRER